MKTPHEITLKFSYTTETMAVFYIYGAVILSGAFMIDERRGRECLEKARGSINNCLRAGGEEGLQARCRNMVAAVAHALDLGLESYASLYTDSAAQWEQIRGQDFPWTSEEFKARATEIAKKQPLQK